MSHDRRTHYEILELRRDAKATDIERAYRKLRRELQKETVAPDPRYAMRLQTAYEVLADPARRDGYDASLRAPHSVLRRARASPRTRWLALAAALAALGVSAYLALAPGAAPGALDPSQIAQAASLAVARVESVDVTGAATPLGLAFAVSPGALATTCKGLSPSSQLVLTFARRSVPAHVARLYEPQGVCRLAAEGMGSWPLPVRGSTPAQGDKVYTAMLAGNGRVSLVPGTVRRVSGEAGVSTIEVTGPAASQLPGAPLLDTRGQVLGIDVGAGRFRPVPGEWIAELRGPRPEPVPESEPRPPKVDPVEEEAKRRAKALRIPDDI